MEQKQKDWLAQIGGKSEQHKEAQLLNGKREAARDKARLAMRDMRNTLYKDMNLEVSDGKKKQPLLNYRTRDQTTEFDIDDQQDGYTLDSDEDIQRHSEANRIVTELSQEFDEEVEVTDRNDDGSPKLDSNNQPLKKKVRLFDEGDLGAEFYEPLVRQGLLPETFVPDEHSRTQAMLAGSFDAYRERLEEDHVKNPVLRFMKENKSLMLTTATSSIALGVQGIKAKDLSDFDMAEAIKASKNSMSWGEDLIKSKAPAIAELSAMAWDFANDKVLEGALDGKEGVESRLGRNKSRLREFERMAPLAVASVATELGAALQAHQLDIVGAGAFSAATKPTQVAAALVKEELQAGDVVKAVKVITDGIASALRSADPQVQGSDTVVNKSITDATQAFSSTVDANALIAALKPGAEKYDVVIKIFGAAGKAAFKAALSTELKDLFDDNVDAIAGQMGKKAADELVAEMEEDEKAAKLELAAVRNAETDEKRAGLLTRKIAALQKEQTTVKWAASIAAMGFDVASKFFAPMAIAGSAMKIAINVAKAAMRVRDFYVFAESQQDMFRAASPYSAPVDNFITNAAVQSAHYEIVAALELVNMIGAIVETAGLASGMGAAAGVVAGKAMQGVAQAGMAVEAVLYEIKKRYDLEMAWRSYRTALLRPANRKLGLMAMKKNPTLAKYAIAWGAVEEKDPLVGDFMSKCGLDAATLKDPKSKIGEVVQYLELRMPDDNVITGRLPVVTDWEPPGVELTSLSWMAVMRRGEEQAKLVHQDTRGVELALSTFETGFETLRKDVEQAQATKPPTALAKGRFDAVRGMLDVLTKALNGYRPLMDTPKGPIHHASAALVRDKFADMAAAARVQVAEWEQPTVTPTTTPTPPKTPSPKTPPQVPPRPTSNPKPSTASTGP